MTIEFKKGRYVNGIWFVSNGRMDWMACLYRDEGKPWELVYRHRYYVDDDHFNSKDRKSWYRATFRDEAQSENDLTKHMHEMAAFVAKHMPGLGRPYTEHVNIQMDSGEKAAIDKLRGASFAQSKEVSKTEYEQMQKGESA